jgi:CHAT domain-containing protein
MLGKENREYATTLHNIGLARAFLGDSAGSERVLRQALRIREKVFGKSHPYYAQTLSILAMRQEAKEFEQSLKQCLEIARNHPEGDNVANSPKPVQHRGKNATEEAFREIAPACRWIHMATHGFFAPPTRNSKLGGVATSGQFDLQMSRQPPLSSFHPGLLSGLAMAGANSEANAELDDGILTALEVASIDLRGVELAVLSACETGLGEVAGGEGQLGLQRAFQVAGARSVVASM